jgi:hypothetical protein
MTTRTGAGDGSVAVLERYVPEDLMAAVVAEEIGRPSVSVAVQEARQLAQSILKTEWRRANETR